MSNSDQTRLDARLDAYLEQHGVPEPPWVRFPEYQAMSLGWRMGGGEDWRYFWYHYLERLGSDEARWAYLVSQPAAPQDWATQVIALVSETTDAGDSEDAQEAARARLVEAGVLRDDAAYGLWIAKCERNGGMQVPWATQSSVADSLRYGTCELGWWARWCAEHSDLPGWLATQPPAHGAWLPIAERLVSRERPRQRQTSIDLVGELAATGQLAPPWVCGEPVWEDHGSYDDDAGPADKWGWWSLAMFNDARSWQRYLAGWPSATSAWQAELEDHLGWLP